MKRICGGCFASKSWIGNVDPAKGQMSSCSFCSATGVKTWPVEYFTSHLTRLLEMYSHDEIDSEQISLAQRLQLDWDILNLNIEAASRFFELALPDHPLSKPGAFVVLRPDMSGEDHTASYSSFSEEIRTVNRYFPKSSINLAYLANAFESQSESIARDTELFRARVCSDDKPLEAKSLGAPPDPSKVGPGRANPPGIAYLYLAFGMSTCIHEIRPENQALVSVGTFSLLLEAKVLDLSSIRRPEFFDEDPERRLRMFLYLNALGRDLSSPVRAALSLKDYIPTQYICEYAKSLGYHGVLYSSSMHDGGKNLVLFDPSIAVCSEDVTSVRISNISIEWEPQA